MSLLSIPKKLLWSNPKTLVWPPVLYFYCKPTTTTMIIMCAIELQTKFILTNINDIAHFLLLAFLHRLPFWPKLVSLVCLWTILYIFPTHNLAIISEGSFWTCPTNFQIETEFRSKSNSVHCHTLGSIGNFGSEIQTWESTSSLKSKVVINKWSCKSGFGVYVENIHQH